MSQLSSHDLVMMFVALGTLLAVARALGECARRLNQPAVAGELLAGILLGPTVLGALAPSLTAQVFPQEGPLAVVLSGLTNLAITLFLVVAGMEVDLSTVWKQGRTAVIVGITGLIFPFALGAGVGFLTPDWLGRQEPVHATIFALFFGTVMCVSALPVIARTLMDLNLYRTDLGMVLIAAAVLCDLVSWVAFAVIVGMVEGAGSHGPGPAHTIWLTLAFTVFLLTAGRWLIHRSLPWIQAHTSWPGGVLGFVLSLALLGAAFTQWAGVHGVFGAFLVGVAVGDSAHLRERTRAIIAEFVSFIFAPLFFASIGLSVNFIAHFDAPLVLVVLTVATLAKVLGCSLGARIGGMITREAWALGFGMNARAGMGIILSLLGLQIGIINAKLFVALVIMSLATSLLSGPAMQRILRLRKPIGVLDYLTSRTFLPQIRATDRAAAISELVRAVAAAVNIDPAPAEQAVLAREAIMPTGLGNHLAIPHARIAGLVRPVVGLGLSDPGVDFDAPDGEPARCIFLILTPADDDGAQLEILADIARRFGQPAVRERALRVSTYIELLALLRTEKS